MIIAAFATETDLMRAAARLRDARVGAIETYTPSEPSEELETKPSHIPLAILVAGLVGVIGMFLLQVYATMAGYPLDIAGKPNFSWPAYIPNAFEIGVLLAILTGFIAFLAVNRLPRLYAPIDESQVFRSAARGGYCLAIEKADAARARELLVELRPLAVEEVAE